MRTALELATRLEGGSSLLTPAIFLNSSKKLDYMKEVRERLLILNKKNGHELKVDLFEGLVRPEEFASRDVREFESEDLKKKMQLSKEWYMKSLQSDFYMKNTDYKDSEFMCRKCKSKKIQTMQKQMRCADEPMTT